MPPRALGPRLARRLTALALALCLGLLAAPASAQQVTSTVVSAGAGPAAKKGDKVTLVFTGRQGAAFVDTSASRPSTRFVVGRAGEHPAALFDRLEGMRQGERRKIVIPRRLVEPSWVNSKLKPTGDLEYDVSLLSIEGAAGGALPSLPTGPAPAPWSVVIQGDTIRGTLSSDGAVFTSLQLRYHDTWNELLDLKKVKGAPGWLGVTIDGNRVPFVQCEKKGPSYNEQWLPVASPATKIDATKLFYDAVTLCSWEESGIGAVVLGVALSTSPPRFVVSSVRARTSASQDPRRIELAGLPSADHPLPAVSFLSDCGTERADGYSETCASPVGFFAVRIPGNGRGIGKEARVAEVFAGLRSDMGYGVPRSGDLRNEGGADGIHFLPLSILFRLVGWLMGMFAGVAGAEGSLIIFGFFAALMTRFATRKEREQALRVRGPSPLERMPIGARFGVVVGLAACAAASRYVFEANGSFAAKTRLVEVSLAGTTSYPVLVALIAAALTAAWAVMGRRAKPSAAPADLRELGLRLAVVLPVLGLAALGAWIVLPAAALAGWAAGDVVTRLHVTKGLWVLSGANESSALAAEIMSQPAAAWPPLAERAEAAIARGVAGSLRVLCAAVLAGTGKSAAGLTALGDLEPNQTPPEVLRYAAFVVAKAGDSSPKARERLFAALAQLPVNDGFEGDLRQAIEQAYPAALAAERLPQASDAARRSRPDWIWALEAGALALLAQGKADEAAAALAFIATEKPEALKGREERVVDALLAAGGAVATAQQIVARLPQGSPERRAAHLAIVDAVVAAGMPLSPDAAPLIRALVGQADAVVLGRLLFATGDAEGARRALASPGAKASAEASWIEARATLATGDRDAIAALLLCDEASLGPFASAEIALALDDRAALERLGGALSAPPLSRARRLLLARVLLAQGQAARAREIIDAMPRGSAEAAVLSARVELGLGRAPAAVEALTRLCQVFPYLRDAHYWLGCASFHARDLDRAVHALSNASRAGEVRAGLVLAEVGRQRGDLVGAEQGVRAVLGAGSFHPAVLRSAGAVAVSLRSTSLANDALARLKSVAPKAPFLPQLEGALAELGGDLAGARAAYGRAGAAGRLLVLAARAKDDVASAEALAQLGDQELERTTSAAVLDAVAVTALGREDLGRADRALALLLALRPGDATSRARLADLRLYRAARAIDEGAGGSATARDLLEDAHGKTGDPRLLRALTEIDLAEVRAAVMAGSAEDRAKALPSLGRARQRAPDDPRGLLFAVALDLVAGSVYAVPGAVVGLDRNVWASLLHGLSLIKMGKRDEALAVLQRAIAFPEPKLATSAWLAGLGSDLDARDLAALVALASGSAPV